HRGQVHLVDRPGEPPQVVGSEAGLGRGGLLERPAGGEEPPRGGAGELLDVAAEQEAVEQGPERVVVGQVVGGGEERQQRQLVRLGAAAVGALVEDGQQVVEDGAV